MPFIYQCARCSTLHMQVRCNQFPVWSAWVHSLFLGCSARSPSLHGDSVVTRQPLVGRTAGRDLAVPEQKLWNGALSMVTKPALIKGGLKILLHVFSEVMKMNTSKKLNSIGFFYDFFSHQYFNTSGLKLHTFFSL